MMFELTQETIDLCFEHKHQGDILLQLYREVYDGSAPDRPAWAAIESLDRWPAVNEATWKYISKMFIVHDRLYHSHIVAGGLWMNNGFTCSHELGDWECEPAKAEMK